MKHKIVARAITLAAAMTIAVNTTCVTALADDIRTETLILNGKAKSEDSLYVLLTKDNHNKLMKLAAGTVPIVNNTTVSVRLDAQRVKDSSSTLPAAVASAEPLLVGNLLLTAQEGSGNSKTVEQISEPVMITLQFPSGIEGDNYNIVLLDSSTPVSVVDMDKIPNTITFATTSFGRFAVTKNAVGDAIPAKIATTVPAVPLTPAAPVQPKPVVGENPIAGGIMDSYAPRTVMGQAVPISMPIPTVATQSGFSGNMAATSMMMTAAFVSGTIDYENSQQDEQPEAESEDDEPQFEDSFDEDAEDGIEEELEGFREVSYR